MFSMKKILTVLTASVGVNPDFLAVGAFILLAALLR